MSLWISASKKGVITPRQHWCGLHLRWLYTLRYGAPSLTAYYLQERMPRATTGECEQWRASREREYSEARDMLHTHRREQQVVRVAIYNEMPPFLNPYMQQRAWNNPELATQLHASRQRLVDGLELLATLWQKPCLPL